MESIINLTIGQRVYVLRFDKGGHRIPNEERRYISDKDYLYNAQILKLNPNKRFHKVRIVLSDGSLGPIRKAYKNKIFYS